MVQFSLVITVVLSLTLLTVVTPPAAAQALRKQALVTGGARSALSSVGLAGPFVFITEGYQDTTEWDGNHRKMGFQFPLCSFSLRACLSGLHVGQFCLCLLEIFAPTIHKNFSPCPFLSQFTSQVAQIKIGNQAP